MLGSIPESNFEMTPDSISDLVPVDLRAVDPASELMRRVRAIALCLCVCGMVCICAPSSALADTCEDLSETDYEAYLEHVKKAVEAYSDGDFDTSIAEGTTALSLCSEDPRVRYNLARAYQKDGDCPMALFHFERIDVDEMGRRARRKANKYRAEASDTCSDSIEVTFDCADPQLSLSFADRVVGCDWYGRLAPGDYTLEVMREGFVSRTDTFVVEGESVVEVPVGALESEMSRGRLEIECADDIPEVQLIGPDGAAQTVSCPWTGELAVGTYTLTTPDGDGERRVDVIGAQQVGTYFDYARTPFERSGFVASLQVGPGLGHANGPLFDARDDEKTGETVTALSTVTGVFVLELGWAFDDTWAVLAHGRLDHRLGIMGGLLGRWKAHSDDLLAIRVDGGLGGGRTVQPISVDDGRDLYATAEPVFVLAGGDVAFALSDVLAAVAGLDFSIGFPSEVGFQADLLVGIELLK